MIAAALVAGPPDECPHPRRRRQHKIIIFPGGKPLALCLGCFQAFKRMIQAWDAKKLSKDAVYRWFKRERWPRSDAEAFITQTLEAA